MSDGRRPTFAAGPLSHFLFPWPRPRRHQPRGASTSKDASRYAPPEGRHVLFAACRDDEEAKEYVGDGKNRGAFSYFLGDALRSAAGVPTYRDLFARASALVSSQVRNQSPQLEATQNDDLDATFLDGAIQPSPATFTASFHGGLWSINGGATSGIPAPTSSDAARLALYPFDAPVADLSDPSKAVAMATVDDVLPASSRLVIDKKVAARSESDVQGDHRQPAHTAARLPPGGRCRGLRPGPQGAGDGLARRQALALHRRGDRRMLRPSSASLPVTASS